MIDSPLHLPKKVRRLVIRKLPLIVFLGLLASGCFAERSMGRPPARSPIPSTAPVDTTVRNAAANAAANAAENAAENAAHAAAPAGSGATEEPAARSEKAGTDGAATGTEPAASPPEAEKPAKTGSGDSKDTNDSKGAEKEQDGKEGTDAEAEKNEKKDPKKPEKIILDTEYDDRRVGDDQTKAVKAEMGIVEDEALNRYVQSVAIRLLRYAPPRPFKYEFKIVDQTVPNAFALPGGKIFVSRGLLAMVESEDELAGVIGHEITHAAERHAAARLEISKRINPLVIGWMRAAQIAAYGRDQERDADRGGQILCAKAGYDPIGIATFLRKLDAFERYEVGWSRLPFFLATHPTSPERSALASDRATSLAWTRTPAIADGRPFGYLSVVDGLVLGDDPAGGLFDGPLFVQPEMRFSIRFPEGWETMNSQQSVAAMSPDGDAQAMLTLAGEGKDVNKVVDEFFEKEADELHVRVGARREIMLGKLPAVRLEGRGREQVMTNAGPQEVGVYMQMTFVAYEGMVYRLALTSIAGSVLKYRGRATAFAMSFRGLDETGAHSLEVTRLRIARALENETLQALSDRTRNELEVGYTGVLNGIFASTELPRGTPIKIGIAEPYLPHPRKQAEPVEKNEAAEKQKP